MRAKSVGLIGVSLFLFALFPHVSLAASPITSCTVILAPGAYTIQNDITATTSPCILVGADNVTINGQGHTITGTMGGGAEGIHLEDYLNPIVSNIRITNFDIGISVINTSNVFLQNVHTDLSATNIRLDTVASTTITGSTIASSTSGTGIFGSDVNGLTVSSSTFADNQGRAIGIFSPTSSSNITITGNTFTDSLGDEGITFYANQSNIVVQNNSFSLSGGGSGVTFDTGVFSNSLVTNNTFTGTYAGIAAYNFSGTNNVYSYNSFNQVDNALYLTGGNVSFVHNTAHGVNQRAVAASGGNDLLVSDNTFDANNQGGYGVALTSMSSTTVQNNQILNVNTGIYASGIDDTRLLNNTLSTSTGDMISINSVAGGLAVSGNTVTNPAGVAFIVSGADGRISGNTLSFTGNSFQSNIYPFAIQSVHNATVLHNTIRGPVWVYDDTGDNSYNDSSTGNTYYLANGTPSWNTYNILDSDGNSYADRGTSLPFASTTLGTTLWPLYGHDAHPYTLVAYVAPQAPAPTHFGGGSSGGSVQNQVATLASLGKTTAATALKAEYPSLFSTGTTSTAQLQTGQICAPYLTRYISLGAANDPVQVTKLQQFLNTSQGESLAVDGVYKQADSDAVKRFQQKYASEVLGVWGLSSATGNVYRTTVLKINALNCGSSVQCPYFTEFNSTTQNATSAEVGKTKELLKELGFYSGPVTNTFDTPLASALKTFQETFSATMLKPWGESVGTGYKYKTTDKFLNMLVGCKTLPVDLDGKGSFDY